MSRSSIFLFILLNIFYTTHGGDYSLSKISTLYIPYYDDDGTAKYGYDKSTIEQIDYDPIPKLVYAVGSNILHVIDASDPENMTILHHQIYKNIDVTDLELCGDYVFFSMDNQTTLESRMNGSVQVLKKYKKGESDSLKVLHQIQVGAVPDMVKPTKDCKTVLVAVEGEAFGKGEINFRDPKGGVGVIQFPEGVENPYTYVELDFSEFNDKVTELSEQGVRFIYRENNNTFDRDVEPEYITYSSDESIAYICLQENNAIAEVDLTTTKITKIHGLGYKSWKEIRLDPSDDDGGIHLATYDIRSFYQPDSIHYDKWLGKNIIIMANEGEPKDYEDLIDWKETKRGKKLDDEVTDKVSNTVKTALGKNSKLGRLLFSKVEGLNADGTKYDNLYTFGGRSMTIRLASDMSILYDSGSVIEDQLAEHHPDIFNSNGNDKGDSTPKETKDTRSDNKGPECETLATAQLDGKLLIFLGSEKPGFISIFSVGDDFSKTRYESTYTGIPAYNLTFNEMYEQRILSEIDPEDIKYVPASESPNKKPVLFVAGSVSCTLSILQIEGVDDTPNGADTVLGKAPITTVILLLIVKQFHVIF